MDLERDIQAIEAEWSPEDGFFWALRQGRFIEADCRRALKTLAAVSLDADEVPRRLVSLLWYIPTFMRWQMERVWEHGGDAERYTRAIELFTNEVERILGVP